MSFSAEFLLRLEKSKTTQQIFNLLIKRLGLSALETSLKEMRGSIPATTLEGNTEEGIRFTAAVDLLDARLPLVELCIVLPKNAPLPLELLEKNESEVASDFDDFRCNLLKNCFHMMPKLQGNFEETLVRDHGIGKGNKVEHTLKTQERSMNHKAMDLITKDIIFEYSL